jgi:hypothetical protein
MPHYIENAPPSLTVHRCGRGCFQRLHRCRQGVSSVYLPDRDSWNSTWFTRGRTLQESLVLYIVEFYSLQSVRLDDTADVDRSTG